MTFAEADGDDAGSGHVHFLAVIPGRAQRQLRENPESRNVQNKSGFRVWVPAGFAD
jgi:hypothetical protein